MSEVDKALTLAEKILVASGSSLRHYKKQTKVKILAAALEGTQDIVNQTLEHAARICESKSIAGAQAIRSKIS